MFPHRLFALLAIDEANLDEPVKVVVSGDSTEIWSTKTCLDVSRMLERRRPKGVPEDMIHVQPHLDGFAEETSSSARLMIVGLIADDNLYSSCLGGDCFESSIRPMKAEALGTALKSAIGVGAQAGLEEADKPGA